MRAVRTNHARASESITLRVLVAAGDVSDLLVMRRLLRDTPYRIDSVRSAEEALKAISTRSYTAVIADDEGLPDLAGSRLLEAVARRNAAALRLLITRPERAANLRQGMRAGQYILCQRPYFSKPLVEALTQHAAQLGLGRGRTERARPQPRPQPNFEEITGETIPHDLKAPGGERRLLNTLIELVEEKVGVAFGHGRRVSALAGALAAAKGLNNEAVALIEEVALVHDIGELAVDPPVQRLKRRLTPKEQAALQAHADAGSRILRRAGLQPAALAAVRHHHERWDGEGYPDRLRGRDIPLAARIVAVADTFDALATARPFRAATPTPRCLGELRALAGSQLDPNLVGLFCDRRLHRLIDWSDPPKGRALLIV